MNNYLGFKILHFGGIFLLFLSLGGIFLHRILGGDRHHRWRFQAAITHGMGMTLTLVGGLGLARHLGFFWPWPPWLILKFSIWFFMGICMSLSLRRPAHGFLGARQLWWGLTVIGMLAAFLAILKPTF